MKNHWMLFVIILFILVSILNIKYWWATIGNSIISIYLLIDKFPRIGNHSTLILGISILLVSLIVLKIFYFKFKINTDFLSYLFRITLVTIYFYTGFHKLNSGFFNSCVSCVNEINIYIFSNFSNTKIEVPNYLSRLFQYTTIIIEMIVPFGLLWHHTRKYTAFILLFFHFYLSFSVFADFGSLALFLIIGCLHDFESKVLNSNVQKAIRLYLIFTLLAIVGKYFMFLYHIDKYKISFLQGVIYNIGFLSFILIYFKNYYSREHIYKKKYSYYLVPLVFIISMWTLKTYVGLGNAGNLTMFSNLVTEKSKNNHFLIDTKKTKLFEFEEDYVEISELKNLYIKENFVGYRVPVVEFKYMIQNSIENSSKALPCKLIYKNKILMFNDLKKSEFNSDKWWYKYLSFRKIQINGPNECRW